MEIRYKKSLLSIGYGSLIMAFIFFILKMEDAMYASLSFAAVFIGIVLLINAWIVERDY